eukprot:scaffold7702_cov21-Tisochrysis_lutea.AAC.1
MFLARHDMLPRKKPRISLPPVGESGPRMPDSSTKRSDRAELCMLGTNGMSRSSSHDMYSVIKNQHVAFFISALTQAIPGAHDLAVCTRPI